jgi:hypothetical protein
VYCRTVSLRTVADHERIRGRYAEGIEGNLEDARIGLLHTMFEGEDEMVNQSIKSP